MLPPDFDFHRFLVHIVAVICAITIHEFSHAKSAELSGDDTAKMAGRVTFNPLAHFDPVGFVMILMTSIFGFGFGWGKPVPVNTYRLRHPRWDSLKVSLWGPLSNLLSAAVVAQVIRFFGPALYQSGYLDFVDAFVWTSLVLAVFNLIPVPPLDGSHILSALMPYEHARWYDRVVGRYGMMVFLILVFSGGSLLGRIIGVPAAMIYRALVGV
jgi:Zn-dependent protease